MKDLRRAYRILWYENGGFLLIILLSWANEWLDLPHHIFGGTSRGDWRESAMETIIVAVVWVFVHVVTRKLLGRLYHLEGFLRVCAWCRRISHGEDWLPLEVYFSKGFEVETSHSICPACQEQITGENSTPG